MTYDYKIWHYNGEWGKAPAPYDMDKGGVKVAINKAGWRSVLALGHFGEDVEVYKHPSDDGKWLLRACFIDEFHPIEITGLPNLIELLTKLAQISTAHMISEPR